MFTIEEIQPMFTGVVVTAMRHVGDIDTKSGLILPNKMDGKINTYQWVEAVGPMVTGVKKGDIVKINFSRYAVVEHAKGDLDKAQNIQHDEMNMKYLIPTIELGGREYFYIQNNDIEFVVTKYSGVDEGGLLQ